MSGGGEQDRPSGEAELAARLKRLEAGLERKRLDNAPAAAGPRSNASGGGSLGRAFRLSAEFVAGIIAGGLLGWGVDRLVGTRPWGLMLFLMLGFAAGIYNVMRASGFLTPPSGPSTK